MARKPGSDPNLRILFQGILIRMAIYLVCRYPLGLLSSCRGLSWACAGYGVSAGYGVRSCVLPSRAIRPKYFGIIGKHTGENYV